MCKYTFFIVLIILFATGIYILTYTKNDAADKKQLLRETGKKKIKHHIPKIMLDLYENRKSFNNYSKADVVRSLIPKISGKLIQLANAIYVLLIF